MKAPKILAGAMVLVAYFFASVAFLGIARNDPDRYYHLALARQTVERGLVRSLPQAENLKWAKEFTDKNVLFTQLTALAYRWGGERAVLWTIPVLGALFLGLLFGLLAHYVAPLTAALLTLSILLVPDEANRLMLLRPHLLALNCALLLVIGLLRERKWICFLGALLFALSYHAIYVPLALLSIFWTAGLRRVSVYGVVGIATGMVFNPYFPTNLAFVATTFSIAVNWNGIENGERPLENVALPARAFLLQYGPFLSAIFGVALVWIRERRKASWNRRPALTALFGAALLFWGLSLLTRRAAEYAIPLTLLLIGNFLSSFRFGKNRANVAVLGFLILQLPLAFLFYARETQPMDVPLYALEALATLPAGQGHKVFHCEWHNSPYVWYARPDLKFVDISDPSLLYDSNRELYLLREKLRKGQVADIYRTVQNEFQSDLVLCEKRSVVLAMEQDRRFRRLYPREVSEEEWATWKPFLYELKMPNLRQSKP